VSNSRRISLSYRDAGVDIDAGDALVETIKPIAESTRRRACSRAGRVRRAVRNPTGKYKEPVLVSGTDGVGTKLKLAIDTGIHHTIGIDLVAMCVNDLIVQAPSRCSSRYYASGRLDNAIAARVIEGIGEGCRQAGCALIGRRDRRNARDVCEAGLRPRRLQRRRSGKIENHQRPRGAGERHAYRHRRERPALERLFPGAQNHLAQEGQTRSAVWRQDAGEVLLTPTRIYVKPILKLLEQVPVHAIAHITGGGLPGNVPRVLRPTRAQ